MRTYKLWTTKELRELKNGRIPKGRTRRACVMFCRRQGIPFPELAPPRRDENGEPIYWRPGHGNPERIENFNQGE